MKKDKLLISCVGKNSLLIPIKKITDTRGLLTAGEFPNEIPFIPKRYFVISSVPSEAIRGEHAHKNCEQFLVCLAGSCEITVDNGKQKLNLQLSTSDIGLYIPPLIWASQYKYSLNAILLVFASDVYDSHDYVRDYEEFLSLIK